MTDSLVENKLSFAGVVVLYLPSKDVVSNIASYVDSLEKLYVVDNSDKSYPEHEQVVSEVLKFSNVEYISFSNNPGIAHALNVAFFKAAQDGFEWVISLDQDSCFKTNILDSYRTRIEAGVYHGGVAIYTPEYVFERNNSRRLIQDKMLDLTMQSASLFSLEIFKKIGPFREDFFLDCVDYDYCCRARKNGFLIVQCAGAILQHNPGITKVKKLLFINYKYGYMSPLRLYYQVRNLLQLSREYRSLYLFLLVLWKVFKVVFFFETKREHLKAVSAGIRDCRKGVFGKA